MRTIISTLALMMLLAMTACSGDNAGASTPQDAADKVYHLMQKGDFDGIAAEFYIEPGTDAQEVEKGRAFVAALLKAASTELDKKGGIKSWKHIEAREKKDGNEVTLDIEVTYGNGDTETDHMNFARGEDGKWYLTM